MPSSAKKRTAVKKQQERTPSPQPANTSQDDACAPAATLLSFTQFIISATIEDIEKFLAFAATTPEGQNLQTLWQRAHKEGYRNGKKAVLLNVERKMEDKLEEGVKRGKDLGREEGYAVAKGVFDSMVEKIKAKESPKTSTADSCTQTDLPIATTGTSVYTQTTPQTATTTSVFAQTNPTMFATTPQSPAPSRNGKNAKIDSASEIPLHTTVFSSPTPSASVSNQSTPSTAVTVLETRPTMANFDQKPEKLEKPPFFNQITSKTPTPSIPEPTDDIARVYASPHTPNDVVLQPLRVPTCSTTASSSELPAAIGDQKSVLSRAVFESQPPTVSTASTSIAIALETRPELVDLEKIHQKVEKSAKFTQNTLESIVSDQSKRADNTSMPPALTDVATDLKTRSATVGFMKKHENIGFSPIFTRNPPKSLVSDCFSWADDAVELPTVSTEPMKQPRDLSCLRSSSPSKNSFSSLQRRRNNKNRLHFNSKLQYRCHHISSNPYYHSQKSYYHSQPPFPVSFELNWDRDPRLADLGIALRSLGWIRAP
jgi:hypothetical protein